MERNEALKRLRRILGKQFAYEYKPSAPTPEQRAEAKGLHDGLVASRKSISDAMEERRKVLFQDEEYLRLKELWKAADQALSKNNAVMHTYKFTVGTQNQLFFHVKAQGDSWEEIFAKLKVEAKK